MADDVEITQKIVKFLSRDLDDGYVPALTELSTELAGFQGPVSDPQRFVDALASLIGNTIDGTNNLEVIEDLDDPEDRAFIVSGSPFSVLPSLKKMKTLVKTLALELVRFTRQPELAELRPVTAVEVVGVLIRAGMRTSDIDPNNALKITSEAEKLITDGMDTARVSLPLFVRTVKSQCYLKLGVGLPPFD